MLSVLSFCVWNNKRGRENMCYPCTRFVLFGWTVGFGMILTRAEKWTWSHLVGTYVLFENTIRSTGISAMGSKNLWMMQLLFFLSSYLKKILFCTSFFTMMASGGSIYHWIWSQICALVISEYGIQTTSMRLLIVWMRWSHSLW